MDYKHNISLIIKAFLLLIILSGCSEEINTGAKLEPESLVILGSHLLPVFYDQEVEIKFGASGGDGVYRYRYIQNPDPEDRDEDFVFNPLELEVENNDGAKASFSLKGIIKSENGEEQGDLLVGTFSYQIEITDGKSTKVQSYEYDLEINKLTFQSTELNGTESAVVNLAATTLLNLKKSGSTQVCDDISTRAYEEATLPNGVKVYPLVFDVRLSAEIVEPLEIFYRFSSKYNELLPERDKSNIGLARPNVDFLQEDRSIILKPGQAACVGYINLLDDNLVEGAEELKVEFYDSNGPVTDLATGAQTITINDNEPLPIYESKEIIRNEGEKIVGLFSLATPYSLPLSVQVSIDDANTTASPDDYLLEPSNGVVTIAPGDTEVSFTISLLSNDDSLDSDVDEIITIVTDIDNLVDVEPYKIHINEWPLSPSDEIVSQEVNKRKALSIDVSDAGTVFILIEGLSAFEKEQAVLTARHRDGTNKNLTNSESGEIILSKQGVRVSPVKAGTFVLGGDNYIGVVANVDGLYADVHRGGGDFIVAVFKLDSEELSSTFGYYQQQSVNQYGSNDDDFALGANFDGSGGVYIFGETNGTEFDDVGGIESNNGGKDGFAYKIDLLADTQVLAWRNGPRFIGTSDEDKIVALDAGRSDVVVLVETENIATTDKDLFALNISSSSGLNLDEVPRGIISSVQDDIGEGIKIDRLNSSSYLLADSQSLLPGGGPTPTFSRDINVLLYNAKGEVFNAKILSTSGEDFSKDIELLAEDGVLAVGGHTDGEFEGYQRNSFDGTDAFISVFATSTAESSVLDKVVQFGTVGEDKVIDIQSANDNKILVLWSENQTSKNTTLTYRVSVFSSEGEMLSTEPE
ncbi:MAG: hypothetical protein ACI9T7_000472 [Oleiphilaceae bacterium]|jgi:hypothetical protein